MRLKITSDGTLAGTWITDAQTGEPLEMVQAVTWSLDVDGAHPDCGLATAVLTVRQVQIDVAGDAAIEQRVLHKKERPLSGGRPLRAGTEGGDPDA